MYLSSTWSPSTPLIQTNPHHPLHQRLPIQWPHFHIPKIPSSTNHTTIKLQHPIPHHPLWKSFISFMMISMEIIQKVSNKIIVNGWFYHHTLIRCKNHFVILFYCYLIYELLWSVFGYFRKTNRNTVTRN